MHEPADVESSSLVRPRTPPQRGRDCFLCCCRTINVATAVCALLCGVAHAMAITTQDMGVHNIGGFVAQALRVFGILFALLIMLIETEWHRVLGAFALLENWVARGFLQVFEATLTYQMATAVGESDFHKSLQLYRTVASVSLLSCGCVYILGGLLCFPLLKRARYRKEELRAKAEKDLEALDKQREELRSLLDRK